LQNVYLEDREGDYGKLDHREVGCEDGKWGELTRDGVQWLALLLVVSMLQYLLL